jgi:hypothetical protein
MANMDFFNQEPVVHTWTYKLDKAACYDSDFGNARLVAGLARQRQLLRVAPGAMRLEPGPKGTRVADTQRLGGHSGQHAAQIPKSICKLGSSAGAG